MNAELMTISNIMTTTESVATIPLKPNPNNKAAKCSVADDDRPVQTDTSETIKTDNCFRQAHNEAVNKHSCTTEDKSQTTKISEDTNDCSKTDSQNKSTRACVQVVPVQNFFSEGPVTVTAPKTLKTADNTNIKQQASKSSPHSIVTLKGQKIPSAYLQNVKFTTTESGEQVIIDPSKTQKTLNQTTGQIQTKNQDKASKISKNLFENNNIQKATTNTGKTDTVNIETVDSKIPVLPKEEQKSLDTIITAETKTSVITDKQIVGEVPEAKNNKQVTIPKSNKPIPETPLESSTKVNTTFNNKIENKTELPSEPKSENNKFFEPQVQTIKVEPEKTVKTPEKPIEAKTIDPQNLSEKSQNNNKANLQDSDESESDSNTKKLKFADVQISSGQVKNGESSTSNKGQDSDSEHTQTQNTQPVSEQTQSSTSNAKTIEQQIRTPQNNTSADVGKQIFESIRSSASRQVGEQQITVRLNPPELGRVFIKFQEQDNQITGILEVSKTQTRYEIEQAIPQMLRSLADSGVQVKRLEVVLNNEQSGNETLNKDQLFQNGDSQNQNHANSDSWQNSPNRSKINELFVNNPVYQENSKLQQVFVNGSLNMLI